MPSDLGVEGKSQSCFCSSSGTPFGPKNLVWYIWDFWITGCSASHFFLLVGKDPVAFKDRLVSALLVWLWWAVQDCLHSFLQGRSSCVHMCCWHNSSQHRSPAGRDPRPNLAFREAERHFCVDLSGAGVELYFLDKTRKCSFCLFPLHTHIFFSL